MSEAGAKSVLIIPGLRDHVEEHWQTHLATELSDQYQVLTVPPLQHNKLDLKARVEAIQQCLSALEAPVVLVAHSAGCLMLLHWACCYSSFAARHVSAALLVTPPDLQQSWPDQYPSPAELARYGWSPLPETALPFPNLVISSSNDHLASAAAVAQMARQWQSALLPLGAVGHLNPASGYGPWPLAAVLTRQLLSAPQALCRPL